MLATKKKVKKVVKKATKGKKNIKAENKVLLKFKSGDLGYIHSIKDNMIWATGLKGCFVGEVVLVSSYNKKFKKVEGIVFNLENGFAKIVIVKGSDGLLNCGDKVYRSYELGRAKAGFGSLGRILDPLGSTLNKSDLSKRRLFLDKVLNSTYVALDIVAPGIIKRSSVKKPFLTGVPSVDSFVPVGCGQRELIIGDNNTGKTSMAITAILNQRYVNNLRYWRGVEHSTLYESKNWFIPCVYVFIGKKRSEVARLRQLLIVKGSFHYTSFMYTSPDDLASLQYLAPYAGCSVGEWFMDKGYDALVVYDDLSEHAIAYRQMSLLLRRPPGREAYPGDVFYLHSRLLERAAQLSNVYGGGSLTALPIIETKGGDVTAYIPTNVISITDGQLFLSLDLMNKGIAPAVDLRLSVSRIGSSAQFPSMCVVYKIIKHCLAMYHTFAESEKIGSVNDHIRPFIRRGYKIYKFYTQPVYETVSLEKQIISLYCIGKGFTDEIELKHIDLYLKLLFDSSIFLELHKSNKLVLEDNLLVTFLISNGFDKMSNLIDDVCARFNKFFKLCIEPRIDLDLGYYNELIN